MPLKLHFLGAAATVTGSQYLLETDHARILIDCGMFQGTPDVHVRNFVPFDYDPTTVDALLLTHAHLDHCGMIPRVIKAGFKGPVYATAGTTELAALVLLDSGRLQQEFAKREMRWEKRHPDRAVEDDRQEQEQYQAALDLAEAGEALADSPALAPAGGMATGEHVPTTVEPSQHACLGPAAPPAAAPTSTSTSRCTPRRRRAWRSPSSSPSTTTRNSRSRPAYMPVSWTPATSWARPSSCCAWPGENGAPDTQLVFSGDLGRPGAPILRDYTAVSEADYVLVETTYGGREHEPEAEAVAVLAQTVQLVAQNKGVLLVPSFAIGRTQDIVYELDRLIDAGKIPLLPLYLDLPMASKASDVYRRHTDYYDEEAAAIQRAGGTPLDYPKQIVTNDFKDSQQILQAQRPYMIVASNGMLTGGRIVNHLRELVGDPGATLLFVGYQAHGTLGESLQNGAKQVRVEGQTVEVRCQVRSISGFSAHADESQLLDWLRNFATGRAPKRVFLVHGDPDAQAAIEPKIKALGLPTYVPRWREAVELD